MLKHAILTTPTMLESLPGDVLLLLSLVDKELRTMICNSNADVHIWKKLLDASKPKPYEYPVISGEWTWRGKFIWKENKKARVKALAKDMDKIQKGSTFAKEMMEKLWNDRTTSKYRQMELESHRRRVRFGGCAKGATCTLCHPPK